MNTNRKYWVMTTHDGHTYQMASIQALMHIAHEVSLTESEINRILDLAKGERLEIPHILEIARQR